MTKALITMYAGTHELFRELTEPGLRALAARHSYTYTEAEVDTPELHPAWSKIPALKRALQDAELALWVDGDCYVATDAHDPADDLPPDKFLAVIRDARCGIATPLMVWRSGDLARLMLAEAWAMRWRDFYPDFGEQSAIALLAAESRYSDGVCYLTDDWTGPEGSTARSRVLHGCFQTANTVPERVAALRERVSCR